MSSGSLSAMPSRCATAATARGPPAACISSRTATVLTAFASAVLQRDLAADSGRSKLAGLQLPMRIGASIDRVVGPHAVLQRRQPDERLERRARLAAGEHGAVVGAGALVAPADHGAHRAGRRVQHHHRALRRRRPPRPGPSSSAASLRLRHAPAAARRAWCARSRRHPCGSSRSRLLGRPVGEPAGAARAAAGRRCAPRPAAPAAAVIAPVSTIAASTSRARAAAASGSTRGIEARRRARQPGQHRRLPQRHAAAPRRRNRARRRVHAPGAGAEIDAVQPDLEDLAAW